MLESVFWNSCGLLKVNFLSGQIQPKSGVCVSEGPHRKYVLAHFLMRGSMSKSYIFWAWYWLSSTYVTEVRAWFSKCLTRSFYCLPCNLGSESVSRKLTKFSQAVCNKNTCLSCDMNRYKSINAVISRVIGKKSPKNQDRK